MILPKLKEATQQQHTQLETAVDVLHCARDRQRYVRLLQVFYGFYAPLEPQLRRVLQPEKLVFDYAPGLKTPLLSRDLQTLNDADFALDTLARCTTLPPLENLAQALGCLYVIEGATLGGQIISRLLKEQLGLDATNGAAFFNGYGAATGTHWKAFGTAVNEYAAAHNHDELIINSAIATFSALEQWFAHSSTTREKL